MRDTLARFTSESLFDASVALLNKLNIQINCETADPVPFAELYDAPLPNYLADAMQSISETYFVGIINDKSLTNQPDDDDLDSVAAMAQRGDKYDGMFVFACEAIPGAPMTRTIASQLTRAFNRIASANPVILLIRQGNLLSLASCERMVYSQQWRISGGEKLGKVSLLRNINCAKAHRGHVDILDSLGDKAYPTFAELYKHWLEGFSNELLTKKFYSELSDWYAWAVQVAKFPNDLRTEADDAKYNHESCIRLITRLIFVWFLKEKKLIPEEFFDEEYIRENLIEEFDPHARRTLMYDAEKSKYYRLILQNLFFAMLNCPIVAEGKDTANNRRFRKPVTGSRNGDYNVNNLMRYESDFMEDGAKKFVKLANSSVPFLNGGLFDCLDDKPRLMYYDGFSERKESLEQLYLPDYLFFGEEVGRGIDLSQWYDDRKKRCVSARGLIDILKKYSFTIEENTPLDQEVSLDPELLGKVFENLLASFNPETQTSARKQTGSFYTPREIVQYMVDESLVAHLKRKCGDELEQSYRDLVSYSTDEVSLTKEQRESIMKALYDCRVLDPACGSGAFPMGILQQMVHVLNQIDPTNEMWNNMMLEIASKEAEQAFAQALKTGQDRTKVEADNKARLEDIYNAFDQSINDPDYARKLYLIEHCIYGVDIQPIATQISKLRFFISLVVDQKPTTNAKENFGIRPLPNLEAKFVTANTLIPLDRTETLASEYDLIRDYEEQLQEINHRIFLAKRNKDKEELRQRMISTRTNLAQALEYLGMIGSNGFQQLTEWNMFDQNASASFFDPDWMFGVKDGFDVVIGNPPYVNFANIHDERIKNSYRLIYSTIKNKCDLYSIFTERAHMLLGEGCICTYIFSNSWMSTDSFVPFREFLVNRTKVVKLVDLPDKVFENAQVKTCIISFKREIVQNNRIQLVTFDGNDFKTLPHDLSYDRIRKYQHFPFSIDKGIVIESDNTVSLDSIASFSLGIKTSDDKRFISNSKKDDSSYKMIRGRNIIRYGILDNNEWMWYKPALMMERKGAGPRSLPIFLSPKKILIQDIANEITATIDEECYLCNDTINVIYNLDRNFDFYYILGLLNSKLIRFWHKKLFPEGLHIKLYQLKTIPIMKQSREMQSVIINLVRSALFEKKRSILNDITEIENKIDHQVYHLYNLSYDDVLVIDPVTPITREEYDKFKLE